MVKRTYATLILLCGLIFAVLFFGVVTQASYIKQFDETIIAAVTSLKNPVLTQVLLLFSALGETAPVMLICAVFATILWTRHAPNSAFFMILTLAVGSALNTLIKHLVERPRPFIADPSITPLVKIGGYSFPSGHSNATMLLYGALIIVTWHLAKTKSLRWLVTMFGGFMILATGLSRIYVRVHYPSDVLAGYASAALLLLIFWAFLRPKQKV